MWRLQDSDWAAFDLPDTVMGQFGAPCVVATYLAEFAPGREGTAWLVRVLVGTAHFDGNRWTVHDTWPGYGCCDSGHLAEGPDGRLWAAHDTGLSVFDGQAWTPVVEGLQVSSIAVGDGEVWMATDDGAWRLQGGNLTRFLAGRAVRVVAIGPRGPVWLGGEDLWRIEADRVETYASRLDIDVLAVGPDGTVWTAGWGGVYRVEPNR